MSFSTEKLIKHLVWFSKGGERHGAGQLIPTLLSSEHPSLPETADVSDVQGHIHTETVSSDKKLLLLGFSAYILLISQFVTYILSKLIHVPYVAPTLSYSGLYNIPTKSEAPSSKLAFSQLQYYTALLCPQCLAIAHQNMIHL